LAWSWIELTFLTGWITGPRKLALSREVIGWSRFVESLRAIIWHEFAIVVVGCAIIAITWEAPNQIGTWTFLVLWVMRTSAKLNLFFGVPNLSEKLLPAHLSYLESFFKRRRFNAFFPISVLGAFLFYWLLIDYALHPLRSVSQSVGAFLVSTLLALAILEHLLLVLPFDSTALWKWALRQQHDKSLQIY
jgi:putative photosynthetic complex assembly protein 2